jgi:hypothetical protein
MSQSFLVKMLCYTWRPFTITLASSAFICAGGLSDPEVVVIFININTDFLIIFLFFQMTEVAGGPGNIGIPQSANIVKEGWLFKRGKCEGGPGNIGIPQSANIVKEG